MRRLPGLPAIAGPSRSLARTRGWCALAISVFPPAPRGSGRSDPLRRPPREQGERSASAPPRPATAARRCEVGDAVGPPPGPGCARGLRAPMPPAGPAPPPRGRSAADDPLLVPHALQPDAHTAVGAHVDDGEGPGPAAPVCPHGQQPRNARPRRAPSSDGGNRPVEHVHATHGGQGHAQDPCSASAFSNAVRRRTRSPSRTPSCAKSRYPP